MDHSFFWGADLRNCLLYGCDLSSAYLGNVLYDKNTLFDEVVVDARTILPKDINVKNYTIKKLDTDFEGHWEYFILPEYYLFK